MFDELSEKLDGVFAKLRGRGVLSESDIKEGLREVRRVLLEADVNFKLTREFLERVEKKAGGVSALRTVSPGQQLVKIVHDELAAPLGERREGLRISTVPPTIVLMTGLQGSGKTTTAAKLAKRLKGEGRPVRLIAADVYRPAAIDQLETLGRQIEVPVYLDRDSTDVVRIARKGIDEARRARDRLVIVYSADRMQCASPRDFTMPSARPASCSPRWMVTRAVAPPSPFTASRRRPSSTSASARSSTRSRNFTPSGWPAESCRWATW